MDTKRLQRLKHDLEVAEADLDNAIGAVSLILDVVEELLDELEKKGE